MSRFGSILSKVENCLAAGSLGAAAVLAIIAVLLRTFFNEIIFWSEEAIIYLVIMSTFFGAVITLRHNEHVSVDIVTVFVKEHGKRVMAMIGMFFLLVYLGVIGYFGWLLLFEPQTRMTMTPALDLPLWVVTLPLPIGFTLMFLRATEVMVRLVRNVNPYPEATGSLLEAEGGTAIEEAGGDDGPDSDGGPDSGPATGPDGRDGR